MCAFALLPAGWVPRRWTRASVAAAGLTTLACCLGGCGVTSSSGATAALTTENARILKKPDSTLLSGSAAAEAGHSPVLAALASSLTSAQTMTTADTIARTSQAATALVDCLGEAEREQLFRPVVALESDQAWLHDEVREAQDNPVGISLQELPLESQSTALGVIAALFNEDAYRMFIGVLSSDGKDAIASEGDANASDYHLAFYGDPATADSWTLVFSSETMGLNVTLNRVANTLRFAPMRLGTGHLNFIGLAGMLRRPLNQASNAIKEFMASLEGSQRTLVYQGEEVGGLRCAAPECDLELSQGLSARELNFAQRQRLLGVIANWVGLSDAETTSTEMNRIAASLNETTVAYSGAASFDQPGNIPFHFTISGPDVFIECATHPYLDEPTTSGAGADVFAGRDAAVQSVYRDPAAIG